jgi:hypothetical protein
MYPNLAWQEMVPRAGFEPANGPVSSTANPVSELSFFSRALSKASRDGNRLSYLGNPRQLSQNPDGELSFPALPSISNRLLGTIRRIKTRCLVRLLNRLG